MVDGCIIAVTANHIIDEILSMQDTHAIHLGNPDLHDFLRLYEKASSKDIVLFWSGSLELINDLRKNYGLKGILVLTENRYAAKDVEDAKRKLERVRNCKTITKALY